MRVLAMNPLAVSAAGTGVLAHFDAEVADGIRVNRFTLKRNQEGELRVFGPRTGATNLTAIAPEVAVELTTLASRELERLIAHDQTS